MRGTQQQEKRIAKGCKKIFGSNGYVHYFYCGDSFSGVYLYQTLTNCTNQMSAICSMLVIPQFKNFK